jgi:hypothetical protein
VRKRRDADADAFGDAQCRVGCDHVDVAYSLAFRYTDADARGDHAACPCCTATDDGACCTASNDGACCTVPGRVVLSAHQWGELLRAR